MSVEFSTDSKAEAAAIGSVGPSADQISQLALDSDSDRAGVTHLRLDLYLNPARTNRKGVR